MDYENIKVISIGTVDPKKVPKHAVRNLAIPLVEIAKTYFEDPENMKKFKQWEAERKQKEIQSKEATEKHEQ